MKSLLDGRVVNPQEISPAKHRFLGMFRPPRLGDPFHGDLYCACGRILMTVADVQEHWRLGHNDVPQYVTIDKEKDGLKCCGVPVHDNGEGTMSCALSGERLTHREDYDK